jgi:hypothetical protein
MVCQQCKPSPQNVIVGNLLLICIPINEKCSLFSYLGTVLRACMANISKNTLKAKSKQSIIYQSEGILLCKNSCFGEPKDRNEKCFKRE